MKSLVLLSLLAAGAAHAETSYFGYYLADVKIGSLTRETGMEKYQGQPARRTHTHWDSRVEALGFKQHSVTDTWTWTTPEGRPLRETSIAVNNGKRTKEDALFDAQSVQVDLEENGTRTHKSAKLPAKGQVFLDMAGDLPSLAHERLPASGTLSLWSYGDGEFGLVALKALEPQTVEVEGKLVDAAVAELPMGIAGTARLFTGPQGRLLRIEYPNAIVLRAEPKAVALAQPKEEELAGVDIVKRSMMKIDGDVGDSMSLIHLRLRIVGVDLSHAPSDDGQTITRDGDGWIVDLHPRPLGQDGPEILLPDLAKGQEAWTKPSPSLSSDDPKLRALAQKLAEDRPQLMMTLQSVWGYMDGHMRYEIGLGPIRDAKEVLRDPKGKCTDYAILATALLRAAGVPTRIAEGLIPADGYLAYHAWCEVWDGRKWVGFDAAAPYGSFAAAYLKLNQGNVAGTLDQPPVGDPKTAKITVLEARHGG